LRDAAAERRSRAADLALRRAREAAASTAEDVQSPAAEDETELATPPEVVSADAPSPLVAIMNRRRQKKRPEEAEA
jgi:hypothetical protein